MLRNRDLTEQFFMPIEDVFTVKERGTVIVGPVEHGTLLKGQEVEVLGLRDASIKIIARDLSRSGMGGFTGLEKLQGGDYGGILLPSHYRETVQRGMVAVTPGTFSVHNLFKASLYLLKADEGGRDKPMPLVVAYTATHWYRPQLCPYDRAFIHYDCSIEHPEPQYIHSFELIPGQESDVVVRLWTLVPIKANWHFRLYQGKQMVGRGVVTQVLDNV